MKFFHISVDKLNAQLVDEFERGNEPAEVRDTIDISRATEGKGIGCYTEVNFCVCVIFHA